MRLQQDHGVTQTSQLCSEIARTLIDHPSYKHGDSLHDEPIQLDQSDTMAIHGNYVDHIPLAQFVAPLNAGWKR